MSRASTSPARAARLVDDRRRWFQITPPEGVPVRFEIATLAGRFGAQLADIALTVTLTLALTIGISLLPFRLGETAMIVFVLLLLAIRAPYYILAELFWNGQTIGKRIMRMRALSADGRGLTVHSVVVRNLMKEVEIFMPATMILAADSLGLVWRIVLLVWILVVLAVPLFNRQRLRIGDLLANTIVVREPKPVLLADLARAGDDDDFVFSADQLEHYGRFELQTLETLLRRHPLDEVTDRPDPAIVQVAAQIRRKISYPNEVGEPRALAFLHAFYKAQRAFLENRQVLGDVRDDKHHREDTGDEDG